MASESSHASDRVAEDLIEKHNEKHMNNSEVIKADEERRRILEQHKGHEAMHMEMLLIFLVLLIIAQVLLYEWKKRHYRSYQMVTLAALWIIPFVLSVHNYFWRFICCWIVFSITTLVVIIKATEKPIKGTTPRLVYKWFFLSYLFSYILGIIAYVIMIFTLFGVNLIFGQRNSAWIDCSVMILFYGLYFGLLNQDVSEMCAAKMASHIGYYTPDGMPTRYLEKDICAVCGNRILVHPNEEGVIENTYRLSCHHVFHEFCIRGWCIVGKKQICPYCKEKVDLQKMFKSPWEKPHVLYGQLLDWLRWMLSWQPVIMIVFQGVNYVLGLE